MAWYKTNRNWGLLVLGIWLIVWALLQLVPAIKFEHSGVVLAVVALVAGVLLLLGR